jgi:integrase
MVTGIGTLSTGQRFRIKLSRLDPPTSLAFIRIDWLLGSLRLVCNKHHVTLRKALGQAVKWNMIPRNICEAVNPPRPAPEEMRTLCAEETRRLLEAARGYRLEALYVLAVHTGMRQGELLGLKWQDVDLKAGTIQVRRTLTKSGTSLVLGSPKTAKGRRKIKLTAEAIAALRVHRKRQLEGSMQRAGLWKDQGLVFASESGTLINPTNLRQRSVTSLLKQAGLPKPRFHDLRHTCATLLLGRGVHAKFVQEMRHRTHLK